MCYCRMVSKADDLMMSESYMRLRTPEAIGADKSLAVVAALNNEIANRAASLVDDELIAEHRRNPFGAHSDRLLRVLHYVRRQPIVNKFVVVFSWDLVNWTVARMPADLRHEVILIPEAQFATYAEAEHEVFRRRMDDLLSSQSIVDPRT